MRRQFASLVGDQRELGGWDEIFVAGRKAEENFGNVSRIKRRSSSPRYRGRKYLSTESKDLHNVRQYNIPRRRDAEVSIASVDYFESSVKRRPQSRKLSIKRAERGNDEYNLRHHIILPTPRDNREFIADNVFFLLPTRRLQCL